MQYVINILPLSHAFPLVTDIILKGLGLNLEHVLVLNLNSVIFVFLAYIIYRFKKIEV